MALHRKIDPLRALDHLTWLLSSPLLVKNTLAEQLHDNDLDSQILKNTDALQLSEYLSSMKRVSLGYYFETLCGYWLEKRPDINVVTKNLPLRDDKKTIGEFDLIAEKDNDFYHIEFALKYYLATGDRRSESSWVGPNRQDRLDIKLNHMRNHQLLLGQRESAKPILKELQISDLTAFPFIKGMLFHAFEDWRSGTLIHPSSISPTHGAGWWLPIKDTAKINQHLSTHWTFLDKPEWIATSIAVENFEIQDTGKLVSGVTNWFDESEYPVLIAAGTLQMDGTLGSISKGFIVPDNWQEDTSVSFSSSRANRNQS